MTHPDDWLRLLMPEGPTEEEVDKICEAIAKEYERMTEAGLIRELETPCGTIRLISHELLDR